MNDKTLLELAAKAAGINVVGDIEKYLVFPERRAGGFIIETATGGHTGWNPLTDDGDALRLAVMLGLSIEILSTRMEPHTRVNGKEEEHRADPYAATRRAIVRAAADIQSWQEKKSKELSR